MTVFSPPQHPDPGLSAEALVLQIRRSRDHGFDRLLTGMSDSSGNFPTLIDGTSCSQGRATRMRVKRVGSYGCVLLTLALSACQTPGSDPVTAADPPAFSTGILTSNEANRLGRADLAAGNYGNAERHFRTAVEENATDVPSWLGLAAAYDNLSRFDLADRAYSRAIALNGETFEIINNYGYSYLLRGDRGRAEKYFARALALEPNNPVARNNLRILRSGERPTRDVPI